MGEKLHTEKQIKTIRLGRTRTRANIQGTQEYTLRFRHTRAHTNAMLKVHNSP